MNKNAIKSFAVGARRRLREQVEQKAFALGIRANGIETADFQGNDAVVIAGRLYDATVKWQREKLVEKIRQKGFDQVMDEAAYTWFNRFIALRFMEVNNYLETGYRVFSNREAGKNDPEILEKALQINLPVDRDKVLHLSEENKSEVLYKYLIITQCNVLNTCLSFMFEKISDYTELLFPDNLLNENSVMREMVQTIPEEDWREVEIIGWLYQYYISEKKDEVFAALKKNQKISKENIPAATQLFTPHWIVRYMVENSLGKLWLESHPNEELQKKWKYYLEPAEQETEVQAELDKLVNPNLSPEDITILDPACGSGHILVYAFEVLYDIYKEAGYPEKDIARLILEKNLYGLDIDDRAAQLACFAVMMKARQKNRRILREPINLNICAIQESNALGRDTREIILDRVQDDPHARWQVDHLLSTFYDAKEYGSIIEVKDIDEEFWQEGLKHLDQIQGALFAANCLEKVQELLPILAKQAEVMQRHYDVVITNPPYMGVKGLNAKLRTFAEEHYPHSKMDLFAMFMERNIQMAKQNGLVSMITMQSWMFLSFFEKLREIIFNKHTIASMVHLGTRAFDSIGGAVVSTTAFVIKSNYTSSYKAAYLRLIDGKCEADKDAELQAIRSEPIYKSVEGFKKVPGLPIAYWVNERVLDVFEKGIPLGQFAEVKRGMTTSDNDKFLRFWPEVPSERVFLNAKNAKEALDSGAKWFPYSKGGGYRKWFGFLEYYINWENAGHDVIAFAKTINKSYTRTIVNIDYYYLPSVGFSYITTGPFSMRWLPEGLLYDSGGPGVFTSEEKRRFVLGCMNSSPASLILKLLNPTINLQIADLVRLPIPSYEILKNHIFFKEEIKRLISIAKEDWNSYEISWDFAELPLLASNIRHPLLKKTYDNLRKSWSCMTKEMQILEEKNNEIFIKAYGLQGEVSPKVLISEITLTCNPHYRYDNNRSNDDLEKLLMLDTIKEFVSYSVGCMMGRYSLDQLGLVYAGGEFDPGKYITYPADRDAIIPILDKDYFEDDIVSRFVSFVRITFGEQTLSQNLDFIADALGRTGSESAVDRIRKYFLNDFYKDHVRTYKKRPIYWLFTSGKQKAFNALIYMHRYDKDTVARIRTDYLHELQGKYELETRRLEEVQNSDAPAQTKREASKRLTALNKQKEELRKYDELLRHYADQQIEIDLDDGVKVNYAKFNGLLAKID